MLGDVDQWRHRLFDPGVVERDVQTPECVDRPRECGFDLVAVSDVATRTQGSDAVLLDHLDGTRELVQIDVGYCHVGTRCSERDRSGAAYSARCTRDKGDLSGEFIVSH